MPYSLKLIFGEYIIGNSNTRLVTSTDRSEWLASLSWSSDSGLHHENFVRDIHNIRKKAKNQCYPMI